MDGIISLYTNCLLPKPLLKYNLISAIKEAESNGYGLVVSSHVPISDKYVDCSQDFVNVENKNPSASLSDFLDNFDVSIDLPKGTINIVTGVLKYSPETILKQIIHSMDVFEIDRNNPVILFEHDVMYPQGYIEAMSQPIKNGFDYTVYYDHIFANREGFFKSNMHFWHLSRYAAKINSLHNYFSKKLEHGSMGVLEPVPRELNNGESEDIDIVDNYKIINGQTVLDFKHGANAAGQFLVDDHYQKDDQWGDFYSYSKLFEDDDYDRFLNSNPSIGYGLFIKDASDEW